MSMEHLIFDVCLTGRPTLQIWVLVRPKVADCTLITPASEYNKSIIRVRVILTINLFCVAIESLTNQHLTAL